MDDMTRVGLSLSEKIGDKAQAINHCVMFDDDDA